MEYPQLVMEVPSTFVTAHELGHQWWFGIVGDDEYNDPWLDEAFASYATDLYFGDHGSYCNLINWPSRSARITNSMAYWDAHPTEYGTVVYNKGPCALHSLGARLGLGVMATFIRDYAVEHALGFSTNPEFMDEAQAVADGLPTPIDLTPFWRHWRIER
jgi:aminopeptidase N